MEETKPDATEKPRRNAQRKLSDADRVAIVELFRRPDLRKPDGKLNISLISKMSGASYNQVLGVAKNDEYWHAQVAEAEVGKMLPTENDLTDPRPPETGITISNADFEKFQAVLRQQKRMVAKDWQALGMDPAMAVRVEKLCEMGKAPMIHVIGMVYGGLIKHVATLDEVLEKDADKIRANLLPPEVDKEGVPVEDGKKQREWRYCWYAGYKLHLELHNSLHKTQAILARVMRDMKALGDAGKPPEKGVYNGTPVSERRADPA